MTCGGKNQLPLVNMIKKTDDEYYDYDKLTKEIKK